jgi:hypothetical protein
LGVKSVLLLLRFSSAEMNPVVAALGNEEPEEVMAEVEWKFTIGVVMLAGQTWLPA